MFTYLSNIALDIYYGYINIKCVNKNCNQIFKMSRNKLEPYMDNHYCCNMGCALQYFNNTKNKENEDLS